VHRPAGGQPELAEGLSQVGRADEPALVLIRIPQRPDDPRVLGWIVGQLR